MVNVVSVACKLPHGLQCDLYAPVVEGTEQMPRIVEKRVTLNGTNSLMQNGLLLPNANGYGITHGVDEAHFTEWMKRNADHPAVKNRLIFSLPKGGEVEKEAAMLATNKNGFEALDPDKPVVGVTKADFSK